jgi:hypothetical protein
MHTDNRRLASIAGAMPEEPVFIGSGLAAPPRPGMTLKKTADGATPA